MIMCRACGVADPGPVAHLRNANMCRVEEVDEAFYVGGPACQIVRDRRTLCRNLAIAKRHVEIGIFLGGGAKTIRLV